MNLYDGITTTFWSEKFWLAHNVTWKDFGDWNSANETVSSGVRHPMPRELLLVFPVAIAILAVRAGVESLMRSLGKLWNVKEVKSVRTEEIPELVDYFWGKSRHPSQEEILTLSKKLDMSERQISRWFRNKRNQQKSSDMKKFCEGGWKTIFHLTAFLYGWHVLYDEDFFENNDLVLDMATWPHHNIKPEFYVYYMYTMGYWMSLIIRMFKDNRRHDFSLVVMHHFLTCFLMALSWSTNFVRIGMLVLFIHDFSDIFIELCKTLRYANFRLPSYIIFVFFYVSWLYTRVYVYPRYVVLTCWRKYSEYMSEQNRHWGAAATVIAFLTVLQVIHVLWTLSMSKAVLRLLVTKETDDHRSASEAEDSEDETQKKDKD